MKLRCINMKLRRITNTSDNVIFTHIQVDTKSLNRGFEYKYILSRADGLLFFFPSQRAMLQYIASHQNYIQLIIGYSR